MKKEEIILFPFIIELLKAGVIVNIPNFETVNNPIKTME
jgi:hypothetical protein